MNARTHSPIAGIDLPVSRIVFGAGSFTEDREPEWHALLDHALAAGCNAFDTAHVYGAGQSERILGKWIADRDVRDRIVVVSKGAHMPLDAMDQSRVTPEDITADLHESLERLQVETIDLYLLHRDDPSVPVEPLVNCLHGHRQAGRIRAYGGSNWSVARIEAANRYAASHCMAPFAASSPHLSLAEMLGNPIPGVLSLTGDGAASERDWYRGHPEVAVLAWTATARGFLSERVARAGGEVEDPLTREMFESPANRERLRRAEAMARERGTTVSQVALAWVLAFTPATFAVMASSRTGHLDENLAALSLDLSESDRRWLNLEADERPF
jgi:aryl-alcohol dehydrogenase-like predicted oxidoreductase